MTALSSFVRGSKLVTRVEFRTPTTTGSGDAGSTSLTVADPSGLAVADTFVVEGAGALGADHVTTIAAIAGNVLTLAAALQTTVELTPCGRRVDPDTITFTVKRQTSADAAVAYVYGTAPEATKDSTGVYELALTPGEGVWHVHVQGTGAAYAADETSFEIHHSRVLA